MNVIAKYSCNLERSVVTLKLCKLKEYLNSVTHTTSVLLRINNWTVWYIERYSMSTYTGVTNWQITVRFFGPTCISPLTTISGGLIKSSGNSYPTTVCPRLLWSPDIRRFVLCNSTRAYIVYTCNVFTTPQFLKQITVSERVKVNMMRDEAWISTDQRRLTLSQWQSHRLQHPSGRLPIPGPLLHVEDGRLGSFPSTKTMSLGSLEGAGRLKCAVPQSVIRTYIQSLVLGWWQN